MPNVSKIKVDGESYDIKDKNALPKKNDIMTIYAVNEDGEQVNITYDCAPMRDSVMTRDGDRRSQVADPKYNEDIANKKYVDDGDNKLLTVIGVLNGEGEGSVKKTVVDEVSKIVGEAPESFDTLKEIADWITAHPESVSEINSRIQENKDSISALKDDLHDLLPTEGLDYTLSSDGTYYTCSGMGTATDTDIRIAKEYNGLPVTTIGVYAFDSCPSLTSVTIPDSVTSISWSAFYGCKKLTGVTIPDGMPSIGPNAFQSCTSLTSVTIPNSVTDIGNDALYIGSETNKATITMRGSTPPTIQSNTIGPNVERIIVPVGAGAAYKAATNWANYADKIEEEPTYIKKAPIKTYPTVYAAQEGTSDTLNIVLSISNHAYSAVQRDGSGAVKTVMPSFDDDAAPKKYVDDKFNELNESITQVLTTEV